MKVFSKVLYFTERMETFLKKSSTHSPTDVYQYTEYLMYLCQQGWASWCDTLPVENDICEPVIAGQKVSCYISDDWCIEMREGVDD